MSDVARRTVDGYMAVSDWVRHAAAEAAKRVHDLLDRRPEYDKEREQYEAAARQAFAEAGERLRGRVTGSVEADRVRRTERA